MGGDEGYQFGDGEDALGGGERGVWRGLSWRGKVDEGGMAVGGVEGIVGVGEGAGGGAPDGGVVA